MELRRALVILLILMTTMMVSCSKQKKDSFLIGDDNCKAPCWNSITPGVTTRTEAINIIEKLQDMENYSFTESDIYFVYSAKRVHVHLDNTNQLVTLVDFELDDILLGQIIDLFGEPEYLSFQLDSGGCTILVYYHTLGAYFMGQCKSDILGNHWQVSRNTKITQGIFTEPSLEEERLFVLLFGDASERMKNNIMKWEGYQSYPTQP